MIDVGTHNSIEELSSVAMFQVKSENPNAKGADNEMGVVFTEMAKSVISALAPNSSSSTAKHSQSSSMSPGKLLDYARSIYNK